MQVGEEHETRNCSLANNDETMHLIYMLPASWIYQTIQCLLLDSRPARNASLVLLSTPSPCQLAPVSDWLHRSSETSSPLFLLFPASSTTTQNKPRAHLLSKSLDRQLFFCQQDRCPDEIAHASSSTAASSAEGVRPAQRGREARGVVDEPRCRAYAGVCGKGVVVKGSGRHRRWTRCEFFLAKLFFLGPQG